MHVSERLFVYISMPDDFISRKKGAFLSFSRFDLLFINTPYNIYGMTARHRRLFTFNMRQLYIITIDHTRKTGRRVGTLRFKLRYKAAYVLFILS